MDLTFQFVNKEYPIDSFVNTEEYLDPSDKAHSVMI